MKFTIRGGTTKQADICRSCDNLFRRVDERGERRVCTQQWDCPEVVKYPVSECTKHEIKYATPLSELKKIAWVLRTDSAGRSIGFKKVADLPEKEKEQIERLET